MDKNRKRASNIRHPHRLFVIGVEGFTEFDFFSLVKNRLRDYPIVIRVLKPQKSQSAPAKIVKRMDKEKRDYDEAWIVFDQDQHNIEPLKTWKQKAKDHHLAQSKPRFEYFLLLFFEERKNITATNLSSKLKHHWPNYDKRIDPTQFNNAELEQAYKRSSTLNNPESESACFTEVGNLVARLFEAAGIPFSPN